MNKIKKIIFLIIIIIVILISVLLLLNKRNANKGINNKGEILEQEDAGMIVTGSMEEVSSRSDYYIVKNIVNRYTDYINQYNTDSYYSKAEGEVKITDEDKKEYLNIISNFYDSEYMKKNNFNNKGIIEDIQIYKGYDNVRIDKMYYQNISEYISLYMVQVVLVKDNKDSDKNVTILIKLDTQNATFSIIPKKGYTNIKVGESMEYSDSNIEKNTYNQYQYKNIDDIQMVDDLLVKYKNAVLYNRKEGYELLDKDYREKRFGDYNTFSKYVENNIKEISSMTFTKYLVNTGDDYKEYVCKDQYENLYIFHEKAVMDCTVKLDTYTLDNDTFNEKYNSSSTQYKVMMNIDKVRQMMNARDYRTMFNYLDETFRTTYFENDEEKFEEYMRYQFSSHYTFEFGEYSEETGISIQEVTMKDMNENNNGDIGERFYMQLNEGTDFVMSFNVIGK